MIDKFREACRNVIDHKNDLALNWCVNYAIAGLTMVGEDYIHCQALYVLSNMEDWTGDVADETKTLLKEVIFEAKP